MIKTKIIIETVTFRSAENWSVFSARSVDSGHIASCTGVLPVMSHAGDTVFIEGEWVTKEPHGKQIKCSLLIPEPPDSSTEVGIIKLLCRLKGVGEVTATKYYEDHGENSIDDAMFCLHDLVKPQFVLEEIERFEMLVYGYEHIVFLLGLGLTDNQANKIFREFGDKTKEIISENPYQMTTLHGMGFLSVDKIAIKAGIAPDNPSRTQACIQYCLQESQVNQGCTSMRGWELAKTVVSQLYESAKAGFVRDLHLCPDEKGVRSQVYLLQESGQVIVENGKVYDTYLRGCEEIILRSLGVEQ